MSSSPPNYSIPRLSCLAGYRLPRLSCLAGYLDLPNVNSAMTFDLKQFPCISARIVRIEGRVFELWSPNSNLLPFFPGERRAKPATQLASDPSQRRYDGHTGRHDCLYAPQYYLKTTAHWPFIRRVPAVRATDFSYPAFQPLTEVWIRSPSNDTEGVWDASFVQGLRAVMDRHEKTLSTLQSGFRSGSTTWAARPTYCTESRYQSLLGVQRWDDAVDYGVAFQRGLRETEAWILMIRTQRAHPAMDVFDLRELMLPRANENLMGLWVNGLPEGSVLLLMKQRVPCFIVHEFPPDTLEPLSAALNPPTFSDFVDGTDVVGLVQHGAYETLARRYGLSDAFFCGEDGRGNHILASPLDEARSSSMHMASLPPWLVSSPQRAVMRAAGGGRLQSGALASEVARLRAMSPAGEDSEDEDELEEEEDEDESEEEDEDESEEEDEDELEEEDEYKMEED